MTNNVVNEPALTAFGEAKVESMSPITQMSAQYGLLTNVLTVTDTDASGTNSISDNKFTCDSGVSSTGLASILSLRQLAYRAGQGALARFTAVFDTPQALNIQAAGLITAENSFTFGYFGTDFGIIYAHDGMDELQELTLTVAGGVENVTVTVDGVPYIVALSGLGTVQDDAFEISVSLNAQVPNYTFTSNDDQVVAQALIPEIPGAFAYSSAGTSVGAWVQLVLGSPAIQEFIPQPTWNADTRISSDASINLVPQMGNVYQIQFQYLGFGAIRFFVEDSASGEFVLVHTIEFANNNTTPSVSNPTFRVGWLTNNFGSTTSVRVQGSSAGTFIEGNISRDQSPRSESNEQLNVGLLPTNVLSFRNRISFGGKVNRAEIFPNIIFASAQTSKAAFFRILLDPVYSTPVTFNYVDKDNSLIEVAKDSAFVTGGRDIGTITVTSGGSTQIVFNESPTQPTAIQPGTNVCIAAAMSSGAASDCQVSVTWEEDL